MTVEHVGQKEKIESNGQSGRKASREKFVEKSRVPNRVKSLREVNSGQDSPVWGPRLKGIRDRLRYKI